MTTLRYRTNVHAAHRQGEWVVALRVMIAMLLFAVALMAPIWAIGSAVLVPGYLANTVFAWLAAATAALLAGLAILP